MSVLLSVLVKRMREKIDGSGAPIYGWVSRTGTQYKLNVTEKAPMMPVKDAVSAIHELRPKTVN